MLGDGSDTAADLDAPSTSSRRVPRRGVERSASSKHSRSPTRSMVGRASSDGPPSRGLPGRSRSEKMRRPPARSTSQESAEGDGKRGLRRVPSTGNQELDEQDFEKALKRESSRRNMMTSTSRAGSRRNLVEGEEGERVSRNGGRVSRQGSKRELRGPPSRSSSRRNVMAGNDEAKTEEGGSGESPKRRVVASRSFKHNREDTRDRLRRAASNRELGENSKHGSNTSTVDREGQLKREGSYRRAKPGDPENRRGVTRTRSHRRDNREVIRSQYAAAIDRYAIQDDDDDDEDEEEKDRQEPEQVEDSEESTDEDEPCEVKRDSAKKALFGFAKGMTKVATKAAKSTTHLATTAAKTAVSAVPLPRMNTGAARKEQKAYLLEPTEDESGGELDSAQFLLDNSNYSTGGSQRGVEATSRG